MQICQELVEEQKIIEKIINLENEKSIYIFLNYYVIGVNIIDRYRKIADIIPVTNNIEIIDHFADLSGTC